MTMVPRLTPLTAIVAALASSPTSTTTSAFKSTAILSSIPRSTRAAASSAAKRALFAPSSAVASSQRLAMSMSSTANGSANGNNVKRIGIIGGGAAGLATARAFLRANENGNKQTNNVQFDVTVLETRNSIGGVWKYDEEDDATKVAKQVTKSRPMYRNLRTNLPKELMAFREFSWGGNGEEASYVSHRQVQQYLEDYANEFSLPDCIHFGCKVNQLKVLPGGGDDDDEKSWPQISLKWSDSSSNNDDDDESQHEQIFDSVCICNGHYALPSSPPLSGLNNNFSGRIMHAVEYDDPKDFAGQTVLCVGARASGADIAREIGLVAKRVYLSDSTCDAMEEFGNVALMPRTQSIDENGHVHFSSNNDEQEWTAQDVDVIIFCSGYDYSFPFINDESNLELTSIPGERRVRPLYEQMWHAAIPSISFIGLPHSVVPFPLFELQSTAVVSQLTSKEGSIPLPSLSDRLAAAEQDAKSGGPVSPGRVQDTHFLGSNQWDYCRKLARISGVYDVSMENYIATNKALYDRSGKERKGMVPGGEDLYRETRFRRADEENNFEILHSKLEPLESKI